MRKTNKKMLVVTIMHSSSIIMFVWRQNILDGLQHRFSQSLNSCGRRGMLVPKRKRKLENSMANQFLERSCTGNKSKLQALISMKSLKCGENYPWNLKGSGRGKEEAVHRSLSKFQITQLRNWRAHSNLELNMFKAKKGRILDGWILLSTKCDLHKSYL